MRHFKVGHDRCPVEGFTLVEVVIAIAILAFSLISILGLMTYTSEQLQQSNSYSRLSAVSGQVLSKLDSQSFGTMAYAATNNTAYYYTYDGLPTNSTASYYQCTVSNVTPTTSTLPGLLQVQVMIRWPPPTFTSTNIIVSGILNYD